MRKETATQLCKGTSRILDFVGDNNVVEVTRRASPRRQDTVGYIVPPDFYRRAVAGLSVLSYLGKDLVEAEAAEGRTDFAEHVLGEDAAMSGAISAHFSAGGRFQFYLDMLHSGQPVEPGYVSPDSVMAVGAAHYSLIKRLAADRAS